MKKGTKKYKEKTSPAEFSSKYKKIFLKVISTATRPLAQKDIVDISMEMINGGLSEGSLGYKQRETVQSSASRYLKELVEEEYILMYDDGCYELFNRKNKRKEIKRKIQKEISFDAGKAFEMSDRVLAIRVQRNCVKKAADLFEEYYREWCYGTIPVHGMVLLLLECSENRKKEIKSEVASIVKQSQGDDTEPAAQDENCGSQ